MSKKYIYASLIVLVLLISSINIFAQFGKNKVQYRKFDWRFIETEHFDVYYDAGSKALAEFAAVSAEKALVSIQNTLNYKFSMRIALIVYDSHNDFQQTNVTGGYLPEGVGGFTELFKNRVVV
ncbi:MAG TPA: biopolymer transporter Tol, partial [Candidatus Kapabacteria bacterium]|nr:biopolymer transporter Tol [Candidatus Kapabacteria bacterium]